MLHRTTYNNKASLKFVTNITCISEPKMDAGCQKMTIQYKDIDRWTIIRSSIAQGAGKRCSNKWIKESEIYNDGKPDTLLKCTQSVCYGNLCNDSYHLLSSMILLMTALILQ